MRLIGSTDVGCVRSENQDNYRAGCLSDGTTWALVCDGMGGANGGKLASGLACDTIEEWMMTWDASYAGGPRGFIMSALDHANQVVHERSLEQARYQGMGTTAVLVMMIGNTVHIAHVGDSRCYLYRAGELIQLTQDHSYVQELVNKGAITQEEAKNHPRKNVITRALGVEKSLEPEYTAAEIQPEEILLLCSDGLTNAVAKERMERILKGTAFYAAAQTLVDAANACGGPDNITVLLATPDMEEQNG